MTPLVEFRCNRLVLVAILGAVACLKCEGSPNPDAGTDIQFFTASELMDPARCAECHPTQYAEWQGSMHAYAADDPVFTALNQRGQREAKLGPLCVTCHAPMALRLGLTTDGSNLSDVPQMYKGVTCYFCHAVADVRGTHDNPLVLAQDGVMRGQFKDPAFNPAHRSGYSAWLDRDQWSSSTLCGSCHDIKTGAGTIERVYEEWQSSVFSQSPGGATCSQCHMEQSMELQPGAKFPGSPLRRLHNHGYPAVDVALTEGFPGIEDQRKQIQSLLDATLQSALCVRGQGAATSIQVVLDNVASGHAWPSGAALVRRSWVEVIAYSAGSVMYQSGAVSAGSPIANASDPDLWLMRDCMLDDQNEPVFPWFASHFESTVLPFQVTFDRNDPKFYASHVLRSFPRLASAASVAAADASAPVYLNQAPDRVTLRIRVESMGLDFIDALVQSGDLDPAYRAKIPVFTLGGDPALEWTPGAANEIFIDEFGQPMSCISKTNLRAQAAKVLAPEPPHCQP